MRSTDRWRSSRPREEDRPGCPEWDLAACRRGASSYANTKSPVVAMAYLDAYTKLVNDVKSSAPDAKADNVQQAVTMAKPGKLYTSPDLKVPGGTRSDVGMQLYRLATSRASVEGQRRTRQ